MTQNYPKRKDPLMKKYRIAISLMLLLSLLITSCSNGKKEDKKGTNDAVSFYSETINQATDTPTNDRELSLSLKKGDTCKYGTFDSAYDNYLSSGNPLENIGQAFEGLFGVNDEGLVYIVETQKITNCIVWIDQWTHNPDGGNTTITNISESALTSTIKNSLSFAGKYASINCEKAVSNTQRYVNETNREYRYDLKDYNTEDYEYAWAVTANASVYRIMFYKFKLWGATYEYVGDSYEIRIDDSNPNWRRELMYRPIGG